MRKIKYLIKLFLIKMCFGFGMIIDGILYVLSLTLFRTHLTLWFAQEIAIRRHKQRDYEKKNKECKEGSCQGNYAP